MRGRMHLAIETVDGPKLFCFTCVKFVMGHYGLQYVGFLSIVSRLTSKAKLYGQCRGEILQSSPSRSPSMKLPRVRLTLRQPMAIVIGFALVLRGVTLLPEYPLRAYPRSRAMDENIRWQSDSREQFGGETQVVKLMIFPTGSPKLAVWFQVDASGQAEHIDNIHNWARQGGGAGQLTDEELRGLREAVVALPSSDPPPPLGQLLVVGFSTGLAWTNRIYDRTKLSPEVLRLCRIVRFKDLAVGQNGTPQP
jgi:hypothetical protein